ncbi:MAG: sulfur oxidation c-type cytochrome SoxX [Rhodovibrio sp.]|nr:sulfur oxidation c-type cytochrome SoxX [Rhodovibrio sp.]
MDRKLFPHAARGILAALCVTALIGGPATAQDGSPDRAQYTEMSSEELAEHLMFKADGFKTGMATQEGTTVGERLRQDALQKTCSGRGQMDSANVSKVIELARNSMEYPDGGIELGDWKKGQSLAENAFGFRVGHNIDDHSAKETGGLCINCHKMEEAKAIRSGTLGPSLVNYGNNRGTGADTKKYTYEVLYNPHVFFPCTKMPRFGVNGVLTQEKISHIMAYLLDPDSPVNK